ncbi:hypothetical protein G6F57_015393 [Rhizopus arrhizus]|nr:hypothetical protein G6F57_015393 [Rhizopus arrhizus]
MRVLADPQQAARIAPVRWSALAQHHDLSLVLLVDPLELQPPSAAAVPDRAAAHWTRPAPQRRTAAPARRTPRRRAGAVHRCAQRCLAGPVADRGAGMSANLPLRDVQLPPAPSWWPPAPGYLMIGAALLLLLLVFAFLWWQRRRRRQRWLQQFDRELAGCTDAAAELAAIAGLLRRAARQTRPGSESLRDDAWWQRVDPQNTLSDARRSLLAEGCRDALVLWGDLLVDGHNRYAICQKHGIEFQTRQNTTFKSMEDVHLWMIENHLGRRSVSDFQRGVLALRKKEILLARTPPEGSAPPDAGSADAASSEGSPPWDEDAPGADGAPRLPPNISWTPPVPSRQALARAARISSNTLGQIEKIQKDAAPELVRAVKEGPQYSCKTVFSVCRVIA